MTTEPWVPDPYESVDTLQAERDRLKAMLDRVVATGHHEQTRCACCDQDVAAYRRTITSEMARALCVIVRASLPPGWHPSHTVASNLLSWVSIRTVPVRGGDYAKLRYWGLLEQLPPAEKDPNQRDSAYWRPTATGLQFALGGMRVPKSLYVYNGWTRPDPRADQIDIRDALREKFDWYKLMDAERPEDEDRGEGK